MSPLTDAVRVANIRGLSSTTLVLPFSTGMAYRSKAKAAGKPVITIPLVLFCDNTSGIRSKKWTSLWNMILAGM